MEDAVAIYCEDCDGNLLVKCKVCIMSLNGPTQWEDHKIGKKHKKNLKPKPEKRSAKVIVPTGTVIIIEQTDQNKVFPIMHLSKIRCSLNILLPLSIPHNPWQLPG